jgi:hypothetical protein
MAERETGFETGAGEDADYSSLRYLILGEQTRGQGATNTGQSRRTGRLAKDAFTRRQIGQRLEDLCV